LLKVSEDWHARLGLIARAKASGCGDDVDEDLKSWAPLFAPFSAVGGRLDVRCLTTADELSEHGKEMQHCVGTYLLPCLEGRSHIVAFHHEGKAVSTAEISDDGEGSYTVIQMRGRRNGSAEADAERALEMIISDLASRGDPESKDRAVGLALTSAATIAAGVARRNPALARRQAALRAGYDVRDKEVVDRVRPGMALRSSRQGPRSLGQDGHSG
jgi:hypothetical protein